MKNRVHLITYVDRLSGAGIDELHNILNNELKNLFAGVHMLPFFYPIDGSDAGFDPIDHCKVDSRLGEWSDVKSLGNDYEIMADLIVNHASAASSQFKDVLKNGELSEYWDLFLTKEKVFPTEESQKEIEKIYRPRPGSCFSEYELENRERVDFWTTFTSNQIDIDVHSKQGKKHLDSILNKFAENNIKTIRLDAAGYAIKKCGTKCFMIPETFDFIDELSRKAAELGMSTLAEIHSYYKTQIEIASKVGMVYDFALPPLILHTLFNKNCEALSQWLKISPRNCTTVLDTHDGIGIIDVGPDKDKPGLLTNDEVHNLVEKIHEKSMGESKQATGAAASNVDLYQVNCTYYDALGKNDFDYLLARAIQFFSPGIPQIYYSGLFAEPNAMDLLKETNIGRDINRPYFKREELSTKLERKVVKGLFELIKLRNKLDAFNGDFDIENDNQKIVLKWTKNDDFAKLRIDFCFDIFEIYAKNGNKELSLNLKSLI